MRAAFAAPLFAASLTACAWMHDPTLAPDTKRDLMAPIDVQALAREVARVRGVEVRHPIVAQALPEFEFGARLLGTRNRLSQQRAGGDAESFWSTFGFAAPGVSVSDAARRALESRVAGFYELTSKRLYLRDAHGDSSRIVPTKSGDFPVLAHEIAHALQDQNFGLRTVGKDVGADEALAYRALVEGDAQLTATGVVASVNGLGGEHWATRATYRLRMQTREETLQKEGVHDDELRRAPPLLRRSMEFPYLDGMAFVGDLVRAGGLGLVNKAFAHPPRTTEEVLHPQKYVDGEGPVPVATPQAPDGWWLRSTGTMGELVTAEFLGQCTARKDAILAATGWGGDAWGMAMDGLGHLAILWSTVWDDEEAAARFERALGDRVACLSKAEIDAHVGREVLVLRDAKRVAYVQGLTAALREPTARALLALPGEPPPAERPFGDVTIPPLIDPEKAFTQHGEYEEDVWTSEPLGIRIHVPEGFKPLDPGTFEMAVQDADTAAFATFDVLLQAPTEEVERFVLNSIVARQRAKFAKLGTSLKYAGDNHWRVDDGEIHDHRWLSSAGVALEVLFRPVCAGRGVVVVVLLWGGTAGGRAINRWMAALQVPAAGSKVCTWLRDTPPE
jgi:hypothetical protein